MYMKTAIPVITLTLSLFTLSAAYSHDVWLYPNQFILSTGDTLTVR